MKFSIHVDTDKDFEKVADMDTYMFLKSEYAYGWIIFFDKDIHIRMRIST